jgi:glycosyltransferase involved in cell wall biosynthesis
VKVAIWPSDSGGCGWVRLRWPAAELARQGYDVEVRENIDAVWQKGENGEPDRVVDLLETDFDVAVLQRMYRPEMLAFMRLLQKRGVAVAIDIDDDLMAIGPEHPSYPYLQPAWEILRQAYREADMVTVSTSALAKRYGSHGRVRVVPNGVPRAYLGITKEDAPPGQTFIREAARSRESLGSSSHRLRATGVPESYMRQVPVVGWTGVARYHPGDLEEVGTSVADVVRSGAAKFRAIGGEEPLDLLGVSGQWHPGAPLQDYAYARLYAELDVAIVPLQHCRFNAGKSWLKGLEAAALGVPFVASPTPEYVRLHELGAGVLAETPKEWRHELGRLAGSADLRAELAAKGREVAARLTIEQMQAPLLWEAWAAADGRRRPARAHGGEAQRACSSASLVG